PSSRLAFTTGCRVDVYEAARERYRIHASSSVRVSVRESRYLTMTGVASESCHSGPLPAVTARAPGTTTAPSGITSGRSADGLIFSPFTSSYTGVDPVSTVPAAITAFDFTITPSYKPVLPPTSASSSTMTGSAPTGSMTPPICAAALTCTRAPTCAHDPTSACESMSDPSPIHAPMFTYIGGMQMTPAPIYAPSGTADPPGTIRTLAPGAYFFIGSVSLSKNGHLPWSIDTSVVSPNLKPSRMPCFTHVLTRQPTGDWASGSAALTSPDDRASRSRA